MSRFFADCRLCSPTKVQAPRDGWSLCQQWRLSRFDPSPPLAVGHRRSHCCSDPRSACIRLLALPERERERERERAKRAKRSRAKRAREQESKRAREQESNVKEMSVYTTITNHFWSFLVIKQRTVLENSPNTIT